MKAVFETGGKQYYVQVGDVVYAEKLEGSKDENVVFENVLMIDGKSGHPYIKGAKVEAKILKQGKAKKIIVYKFKAKKKYRRTQGHRQPYTKLEITNIVK